MFQLPSKNAKKILNLAKTIITKNGGSCSQKGNIVRTFPVLKKMI